MPEWTEQQKLAIETRGEDLLVAAAAGSGKTAVLSARVGDFVERGGRLDRLLVVTFTKLAAAEMRSRIARELNSRAAKNPSDVHLRRQCLTLYKAKISTIDSFGIDLLRRNFQRAGVAPDFTVMDETDLSVLKASLLQGQMEEYYNTFPEGFADFLALFGGDTDDRACEEVLSRVSSRLEAIPFPQRWLEAREGDSARSEDAVAAVCACLLPLAEEYREILAEVAAAAPYGPKGNESVGGDYTFFCRLCILLSEGNWDGVCDLIRSCPLGKTASARGEKTKEAALYSEYRSASASSQSESALYPSFLKSEIFSLSSQSLREDLAQLKPGLTFLYRGVAEHRRRLLEEMHRRSAYSFAALSQMALELVVAEYSHGTGDFVPSAVALAERELYDEVLIDEYQDVNDLQDLFFRAVTRNNCFAVGDVKQSIYGFRGANPENFLRKKAQCRVIALNKNFRSRKGILDYVNFLFRGLFSMAVGGMEYDDVEALFPGRKEDGGNPYPQGYAETLPAAGEDYPPAREKSPEPHAELLLLPTSSSREDSEPGLAEGEALLCAKLIRDALAGGATVYDKGSDGLRPLRPSDIAILLRAASSVPVYEEVFRSAGIPLLSADGGTFLDTPEVGGVLAFLQTVNDPWDDLSLFVTLTGSVFSFSAEKVSRLRDPKVRRPLWESLRAAAREDSDCAAVLHTLEHFRILSENLPVPRLVWEIYTATDYLALESAADPNARANLMKFYSFACRYPRADGLFGFLEFAARARRSGNVKQSGSAPEGDFVRIMTVHKSKGLEFAWCIVPEINRGFPADRDPVPFDRLYGVAPRVRNGARTASYTTLLRELIKLRRASPEAAERLRVLYVALTRARDRLTVIGRCPADLSKTDGHALHSHKGKVRTVTLLSNNNYRKILMDRTVLHPKATVLHSPWEDPEPTSTEDLRVAFVGVPAECSPVETPKEEVCRCGLSAEELNRRFSFGYDGHLTAVPAKVSVTEIAKYPLEGDSEPLFREPPVARPKFLDEESLTAAETGTAMHTYCQFAHFDAPVEEEISRLVREGHLTEEAAKVLDRSLLTAFLQSDLMHTVGTSLGYEREVRFVCRIPVSYYSGNPGEEGEMLMQGAIDLLCETSEGYWILDFKSDRASEEELLSRYARQLNLYAAAVRRLYDKPVLGCKIWAFRLKKSIDVPEEML